MSEFSFQPLEHFIGHGLGETGIGDQFITGAADFHFLIFRQIITRPAAHWWIEFRRDALGKSLTFLPPSFAANTSHEENSNGTCGARPSERCRKT